MSTYTGTTPKDLVVTTPTEGATPPSEINDAIRELKTVFKSSQALAIVTSDPTLAATHHLVLCNATGGAFNVTLPTASDIASTTFTKEYVLMKTDGTANAVTVVGTVSGSVNPTLTSKYQVMVIACDGTNYYDITPAQPVKFNTYATDQTLTLAQCYNQVIETTGAAVLTLPAGAKGMNLIVRTSAHAVSVDPNGTEVIVLNGTAGGAGKKITNTSTLNDTACLYHNGTNWIVLGYSTWTMES